MRISIIGTAGRKPYTDLLNLEIYRKMYSAVRNILNEKCEYQDRHLISGGAAWADHLAVKLFLHGQAPSLTLYMPSDFDGSFYGSRDAQTANYYHSLFESKTKINSLLEISQAIEKGAKVVVGDGFKARNNLVADTDLMIALTFGTGTTPADGGTSHTWNQSKAPIKIHIPIGNL